MTNNLNIYVVIGLFMVVNCKTVEAATQLKLKLYDVVTIKIYCIGIILMSSQVKSVLLSGMLYTVFLYCIQHRRNCSPLRATVQQLQKEQGRVGAEQGGEWGQSRGEWGQWGS